MSKVHTVVASSVALLVLAGATPALAQSAGAKPSAPPTSTPPTTAAKHHRAWLEAGIFGGMLAFSKNHSVYELGREAFKSPMLELGARMAVLPAPYFGIEAEGMIAPTRTKDSDVPAGIWSLRGHALLQVPIGSFTPFVLVGAGALGAGSNPTGSDVDPAVHFGGGAKVAFDNFVGARLDVRDVIHAKYSPDGTDGVHSPEVLLGLTFSLDFYKEPKPEPLPADTDIDGIPDSVDRCPNEGGPGPTGCPLPVDTDGDGFIDDKDACPSEKGEAPVGCPDRDRDRDCVSDPADKCPNEAGIQPDGCPDPDPDRDRVLGAADKCPTEQETRNGFEDQDGCPDTLPEKVKKFSGVIPGIEFDFGKATIRAGSTAVLNEAAGVLKEYPTMRVAISGHTDNVGDAPKNIELSKNRADSVKAYLVSQGVAAERIDTRGAGPDEPIADNKTPAGRQKNRRIEFKLLSQD